MLKVDGISPKTADSKVAITKATITDSILSNSVIDASSIKTGALSVKGPSDFSDDIFVEGSITVRGTVMGSGPYVDSSDVRFKKNITSITNALDIVCDMGGVSYIGYKQRNQYSNFLLFFFSELLRIPSR